MAKKLSILLGSAVIFSMFATTASARFLSTDPVTMTDADMDPRYFNRYSYSFNDPLNNIDPDGQRVRSTGDNTQAALAVGHLSRSPTFEKQYGTLVGSSKTYNFNVSSSVTRNNFVPSASGGTININPTAGTINGADEVSSPASSLGHEVAHAVQRDGNSLSGFQDNSRKPETITGMSPITDASGNQIGEQPVVSYGTSPNEVGATIVQNQINSEIGEPQRQNYEDSSRVTTCGVDSTNQC